MLNIRKNPKFKYIKPYYLVPLALVEALLYTTLFILNPVSVTWLKRFLGEPGRELWINVIGVNTSAQATFLWIMALIVISLLTIPCHYYIVKNNINRNEIRSKNTCIMEKDLDHNTGIRKYLAIDLEKTYHIYLNLIWYFIVTLFLGVLVDDYYSGAMPGNVADKDAAMLAQSVSVVVINSLILIVSVVVIYRKRNNFLFFSFEAFVNDDTNENFIFARAKELKKMFGFDDFQYQSAIYLVAPMATAYIVFIIANNFLKLQLIPEIIVVFLIFLTIVYNYLRICYSEQVFYYNNFAGSIDNCNLKRETRKDTKERIKKIREREKARSPFRKVMKRTATSLTATFAGDEDPLYKDDYEEDMVGQLGKEDLGNKYDTDDPVEEEVLYYPHALAMYKNEIIDLLEDTEVIDEMVELLEKYENEHNGHVVGKELKNFMMEEIYKPAALETINEIRKVQDTTGLPDGYIFTKLVMYPAEFKGLDEYKYTNMDSSEYTIIEPFDADDLLEHTKTVLDLELHAMILNIGEDKDTTVAQFLLNRLKEKDEVDMIVSDLLEDKLDKLPINLYNLVECTLEDSNYMIGFKVLC